MPKRKASKRYPWWEVRYEWGGFGTEVWDMLGRAYPSRKLAMDAIKRMRRSSHYRNIRGPFPLDYAKERP